MEVKRYLVSMFLKRTKSKNFTYLSIVETFRSGHEVKHRTLLQLGREDEVRANGALQRLVESIARVGDVVATTRGVSLGGFEEQSRSNWGAVAVFRKLWELYDLTAVLDSACRSRKRGFNLSEAVFATVLGRVMRPSSKRRVYERQDDFFGVSHVPLQHFYRAMDALAEGKDEIEQQLFERQKNLFNLQIDVVLYDVTTLYFESVRADELKDFGFSKDAKFGEVQIVLGLLTDTEGRPIGFDVFPGNTFEGHTLVAALHKLKKRFQIRQVVIVADRGMNSKVNLCAIKEAGFDYIVGSRLKSLCATIREDVLDRSLYKPLSLDRETGEIDVEIRSIDYSNDCVAVDATGQKTKVTLSERLICTWSKGRAEKDVRDRDVLVTRAKEMLEAPSKIVSKRGPKRFISTDINKEPIFDEQKVREDARWDGFYGIQCSHKTLRETEILEAYHTLWRIEDSFRTLKHSLQTRPIFHWTPRRIKGHLVMCFISFLLERTAQLELKKRGLSLSPEAIRDALNSIQVSLLKDDFSILYLISKPTNAAASLLKTFKIPLKRGFSSEPPI